METTIGNSLEYELKRKRQNRIQEKEIDEKKNSRNVVDWMLDSSTDETNKTVQENVKIGTDNSTTNEINSEVVVKKFDPALNCGESEDLIKSVECKRKIKRPDVVVPETVPFDFISWSDEDESIFDGIDVTNISIDNQQTTCFEEDNVPEQTKEDVVDVMESSCEDIPDSPVFDLSRGNKLANMKNLTGSPSLFDDDEARRSDVERSKKDSPSVIKSILKAKVNLFRTPSNNFKPLRVSRLKETARSASKNVSSANISLESEPSPSVITGNVEIPYMSKSIKIADERTREEFISQEICKKGDLLGQRINVQNCSKRFENVNFVQNTSDDNEDELNKTKSDSIHDSKRLQAFEESQHIKKRRMLQCDRDLDETFCPLQDALNNLNSYDLEQKFNKDDYRAGFMLSDNLQADSMIPVTFQLNGSVAPDINLSQYNTIENPDDTVDMHDFKIPPNVTGNIVQHSQNQNDKSRSEQIQEETRSSQMLVRNNVPSQISDTKQETPPEKLLRLSSKTKTGKQIFLQVLLSH